METVQTLIHKSPSYIRLNASSICQLRCSCCGLQISNIVEKISGKGFLKFENFEKFIRDNPSIKKIELSHNGEIFLNPDILKILKFAYENEIELVADNGSNLNDVNEEVLEGLVKYKFRSLNCSIDGATDEIYKIYRINGNLNKVINNIKKINYYKEKYNSQFPVLSWQFIVFGHNEHELPLAKKMASELNMIFYPKMSWNEEYSPIRDREFVMRETNWDSVSRSEFYDKNNKTDYMRKICLQLWENPQINWDGSLLGCCTNNWWDFGSNVFNEGLEKSLNSEKISYARSMLMGKIQEREDIPCTLCFRYKKMKLDKNWITEEETI